MKVSDGHSPYIAVGAFDNDEAARAVVRDLRREGVPPEAISVARGSVTADTTEREVATMSRVFWSGLISSAVGGLGGAGIGLVVGLAGVGVPGTSTNIGIQIAAWAMFAHVLGALLGCYLALDTGDRFARKTDHHDRSTLVRVRSADASTSARAEQIMRAAGAMTETEARLRDRGFA